METALDTAGNDADVIRVASTACLLLLTVQVLSFFPLPDSEGLFWSCQSIFQLRCIYRFDGLYTHLFGYCSRASDYPSIGAIG